MRCTLRQPARRRGAILLEIVLALAIFAGASVVVHLGLSRSMAAARRLRLDARAENLALSKLAEIQAGIVEASASGPNSYDEADADLAGWEWSVGIVTISEGTEAPPMRRVTVTVKKPSENIAHRVVRLFPEEGGEL